LSETRLIREIGGFKAICKELIDDCALAKRVKSLGYKTWIGLTHSVHSLRSNEDLAGIWDMVARTAFCQLRYSVALLRDNGGDAGGILAAGRGIILSCRQRERSFLPVP